jgi:hypothetical protein
MSAAILPNRLTAKQTAPATLDPQRPLSARR